MNDVFVYDFNRKTFNEDGKDSAIFKKYLIQSTYLIFQNLPVKEKVRRIVVNRMANASIIDTLTSVDFCEIVKMGGKVIRTYEGVTYRGDFKILPFRKIIEKLLTLKQKYTDEINGLMQGFVK